MNSLGDESSKSPLGPSASCQRYNNNPTFQKYAKGLEVNVQDGIVQGVQGRWQSAIPVSTTIVYRNYSVEEMSAVYQGQGQVTDSKTNNTYSLSQWCQYVDPRNKRGSILENASVENVKDAGKFSISAPQACGVLLKDKTGEIVRIRLKMFDFVFLECVVGYDDHEKPLSWVCDDSQSPVLKRQKFCEEYIDYEARSPSDESQPESINMDCLDDTNDEPPRGNDAPPIPKVPPPPPLSGTKQPLPLQTVAVQTQPFPVVPKQIPVAYNGTKECKTTDFPACSERSVWDNMYGDDHEGICIICDATKIVLSKRDRTQLCHVNPRGKLGRNDVAYNYIFACTSCNNNANRSLNLFDQMVCNNRSCNLGILVKILMRMYFSMYAFLDYEFSGRVDFVRKVYGEVSKGHGSGIEDLRVFKVLEQLDCLDPLEEYMRNPIKYAIWKCKNNF